VQAAVTAPVVFEIIKTPVRVGFGVLLLVFVAASWFAQVLGPERSTIRFETFAVNVIGQCLHVGELAV